MKKVIIFPLEPLDARYTKQWYTEVPNQLDTYIGATPRVAPHAMSIVGEQKEQSTTAGAFLNFADTNYWKSTQLANFVDSLHMELIPDDAILFFTDFWNPAIIQVAYMRDLLGKQWEIHSIAHAGAYDPSDILGYKMDPDWAYNFERSLYYAHTKLYFATHFHCEMFLRNLDIEDQDRAVVAGQPYEYLLDKMAEFDQSDKTNTVMWPHRYNDDKQPEIAEDLSNNFDVFITQKHQLSKDEYYAKLAKSKIVFSCSLHENLGMSMIEGTLVGALPIAPDRAAYSEIYLPEFLYPSKWTESVENYHLYKDELVAFINSRIQQYDKYAELLPEQRQRLLDYITPQHMFKHMLGEN